MDCRIPLAALAFASVLFCGAAGARTDYRALELFAEVMARVESTCPLGRERALAAVAAAVNAMPERAGKAPLRSTYATSHAFMDALGAAAAQDPRGVSRLMRVAIDGMMRSVSARSYYSDDIEGGQFLAPAFSLRRADPYPVIRRVTAGSMAERAGLRAGDALVSVEGRATTGVPLDEIQTLLRGPQDSSVVLSISRVDVSEPLSVTVAREPETRPPASAQDWRIQGDVGVIDVPEMRVDKVRDAVRAIGRDGARPAAFVLDLRDNIGGRLDDAIEIADLFVESGVLAIVSPPPQCAPPERQSYAATGGDVLRGAPLIVLIGPDTASGGELLAAALVESDRARAVGQTTLGSGEVETVIPLEGGRKGMLRIATGVLAGPSGRTFDGVGIAPEFVVPDADGTRDHALEQALRLLGAGAP